MTVYSSVAGKRERTKKAEGFGESRQTSGIDEKPDDVDVNPFFVMSI